MQLRPKLVSSPGALLTLTEIKEHCRIEGDVTEFDDSLTAMGVSATEHLDGLSGILGRCINEQTWEIPFCRWHRTMRLPFPDVSDVEIKYYDEADSEVTLSDTFYIIQEDARSSFIWFKNSFASPSLSSERLAGIVIRATAGFDEVPEDIKRAAMLLVGHWNENHEAVGDVPEEVALGFESLTEKYRRNVI